MYDRLWLRLPGRGRTRLGLLTLVFPVQERSTIVPQPDDHDTIYKQRQYYLYNRMSRWGQRTLRFKQ